MNPAVAPTIFRIRTCRKPAEEGELDRVPEDEDHGDRGEKPRSGGRQVDIADPALQRFDPRSSVDDLVDPFVLRRSPRDSSCRTPGAGRRLRRQPDLECRRQGILPEGADHVDPAQVALDLLERSVLRDEADLRDLAEAAEDRLQSREPQGVDAVGEKDLDSLATLEIPGESAHVEPGDENDREEEQDGGQGRSGWPAPRRGRATSISHASARKKRSRLIRPSAAGRRVPHDPPSLDHRPSASRTARRATRHGLRRRPWRRPC